MRDLKGLKVLYVGSLHPSSNSFKRFQTFQQFAETTGVNVDDYIYRGAFTKFHHHLNIGPGVWQLNRKVKKQVGQQLFDILFVDNRPFLTRQTLMQIRKMQPAIRIVNILTDDPNGKFKSGWRLLKQTASLYDKHFVQREVNIAELKGWGAAEVELCYRSYDPLFHRPIGLNAEEAEKFRCKVGFIGTHEDVRERFIVYLIDNGIDVQVVGNDWENATEWKKIQPHYKGKSVYGDDYIRYLNGMDIALHFLRHGNRDEQDSRTFEIPACGTFMMAERSAVHESLFTDGEEAVFFSTEEELLEKTKYYLQHPEERKKIAENGHQRCLTGKYDHYSRLMGLVNSIYAEK